jgi:hypothetical protein
VMVQQSSIWRLSITLWCMPRSWRGLSDGGAAIGKRNFVLLKDRHMQGLPFIVS